MYFKDLFHGHDTHTEEHETHTIYFNKDFPKDEYYNFITLNKSMDDYDLFTIIQTEQEYSPLRFITKQTSTSDLFTSLNFEVEEYTIYQSKAPIHAKKIDNLEIKEINTLQKFQSYRDSYTDQRIEEKYLKSKRNHTIVAEIENEIVGSMILHEHKDFLEIDDLFVLESHRSQGIAQNLLAYARDINPVLRTITDGDHLPASFKALETIIIATRY